MTRWLEAARGGDAGAREHLLGALYSELRAIARHHMRGERRDHTLQPTALVHEAVLRMFGGAGVPFADRNHFLRTASRAMRRVLVDHARARGAAKRDGGIRVTLSGAEAGDAGSILDVLVLDDALSRLAAAEPRWAEVVELRYLLGLEVAEVAEVLGVSTATVKRDWRFAKAWLARELDADAAP